MFKHVLVCIFRNTFLAFVFQLLLLFHWSAFCHQTKTALMVVVLAVSPPPSSTAPTTTMTSTTTVPDSRCSINSGLVADESSCRSFLICLKGGSSCYSAMINVTLAIRNRVREPKFEAQVTIRVQRQPLRYILLMAAGLDPRFRYETHHFEGYGDYVFSINGLSNDVRQKLAVWQPHSNKSSLIMDNLDVFIPENNDVITFIYTEALGQDG